MRDHNEEIDFYLGHMEAEHYLVYGEGKSI
jgi:hypothetical protein